MEEGEKSVEGKVADAGCGNGEEEEDQDHSGALRDASRFKLLRHVEPTSNSEGVEDADEGLAPVEASCEVGEDDEGNDSGHCDNEVAGQRGGEGEEGLDDEEQSHRDRREGE